MIALALAGLAGCATTTTRANLSNSAQNLEYNSAAMVRDAGDVARSDEPADNDPRYSDGSRYPDDSRYSDDAAAHHAHEYARDARALAQNAHELRVAVDQGADDAQLHAAFDRVSRSYHAVRDEVAHSDSPRARRDFGPVTDSYRAIEHSLGIPPDRDDYVPPA